MRVTVMCDASFCHETRVMGYGFWIASKRGNLPGGGTDPNQIANVNVAEVLAVSYSLFFGRRRNLILPGDEVLVQTDSMNAIAIITGAQEPPDIRSSTARDWIAKFADFDIRVNFRHIKGHSQEDAPRYAANRLCDMRARQAMRLARRSRLAAAEISKIDKLLNKKG